MTRQVKRLTPRGVAAIDKPGRHADGDGLYLIVDKPGRTKADELSPGAKRWAFLFRWKDDPLAAGAGRLREMGLGSASAVPLAKARDKAAEARAKVAAGVDPIKSTQPQLATPTFGAVADELVASLSASWRNEKHRAQWSMALTSYAAPLRPKPIDAITTEDVLAVLAPVWTEKPETASRLRGRIERVLDAGKARGLRTGENPARWRGNLDHLLPRRHKLTRGHHAALPYDQVPTFVADLHERQALAALALEFLILTAGRSGEVRGALWSEIDLEAKLWTIPADRMKGGREHRVPLCDRATEILEQAGQLRVSDNVFPGDRRDQPLSSMAFEMLLRRMKVDVTAHGFRSSFRDWAGEATAFPREVAEAALAHQVGNAVELAYRRGDALAKRRELMTAWGRFCEPVRGGNVVALAEAGR